MTVDSLGTLIVLALACSAISVTLAKSRLFAGMRAWLLRSHPVLGELAGCTYCTSHWVALTLVLIYRPVLLTAAWPIDLVTSAFAVVGLSTLVTGWMVALTPFRGDEPPLLRPSIPPVEAGYR